MPGDSPSNSSRSAIEVCAMDSFYKNILEVESFTVEDNIVKGSDEAVTGVSNNMGCAIFDTLSADLDHVAQIETTTGKQTTFREMKDQSVRCALWMKHQGVKENDIIAVCSHNHLDTYIPVFATFYVDAIHNAWNNVMMPNIAQYFIKLFKPKMVFADEGVIDVLVEASKEVKVYVKFIVFGNHHEVESLNDIMQQQSSKEVATYVPCNMKRSGELSLIYMTSGSTGYPKAVLFSNDDLLKNVYPDIFSIAHKRILWYSILYWMSGFLFMMGSLFNKATRIIHLRPNDVENLCKIIEEYKIQYTFIIPFTLANLAKSNFIEKYDMKSLETILTSGSKPNKFAIENLQNRIPNMRVLQTYGMTELGRVSFIQTKNRNSYESLGFVIRNTHAKIINVTTGEALGPNEKGEMCIKTPTMMIGYLENPEKTREAIDREGWLHCGDLCYYNELGEFFFVERLKEIMKYRNIPVSPAEIEEVLLSHPAVMEVAVAPVPHEIDGERPMAFVKLFPEKKVTSEELVELSHTLGENKKLWGGVMFVNNLPKTGSGKISRLEVRKMASGFSKNTD